MFCMFRNVLIGLVVVAFFSLNSFALPNNQTSNSSDVVLKQEDSLLAFSPPVSFPVAILKQPFPKDNEESGPTLISSSSNRGSVGSHSSLTLSEMHLVMAGGRNFDPYTKRWGYRNAFVGEMRNNFMFSWEAKRIKNNVKQLIPNEELYSKN